MLAAVCRVTCRWRENAPPGMRGDVGVEGGLAVELAPLRAGWGGRPPRPSKSVDWTSDSESSRIPLLLNAEREAHGFINTN